MDGSSTSRIRKFGEFRKNVVETLERQLFDIEQAMDAVRKNPGDAGLVAEAIRRLEEIFGLGGPLGMAQICRAASLFRPTIPTTAESEEPGIERALRPYLAPAPAGARAVGVPRRVFVVSSDPEPLARALRPFGYDVLSFEAPAALEEVLGVEVPLAVLWGMSSPPPPGLRSRGMPFFIVSKNDGLEARIGAVRSGARGFYTTDDAEALADGLDRLWLEPLSGPPRVMIVDDDPVAAGLHAAILRGGGMSVATVTDPGEALDALLPFDPDLMLLDMDLGPFTGDELAAAARQHPAFVGIPIVFLSSESRPAFQFAARGSGAEDFLVKPVPPPRLLSEVLLRAEQGRALRTHLLLDGPTGALNATAFPRRLRAELDLARRRGRALACARVSFGGDAAPRRLHELLRARLRSSDMIGRSGARAFLIALPDCDAATAARILGSLRGSTPFEGAVAGFPEIGDAGSLLRALARGGPGVLALGGESVV